MCLPDTPKYERAAAPPPPPNPSSEAILEARKRERRIAQFGGRQSAMLTGASGVASQPVLGRATLVGA